MRWPCCWRSPPAPPSARACRSLPYRPVYPSPRLPRPLNRSTDVEDRLRDLVRGIERLGISLEVLLRGDQIDQFLRDIDVRALDRARHQRTIAVVAGHAVFDRPRNAGRLPITVAHLAQPGRVVEIGDRDLAEDLAVTVRETRLDHAGVVHGHARKLADRL